MDVLSNITVVIISQHTWLSNHYTVHLKFTKCYMLIISQYNGKEKELTVS